MNQTQTVIAAVNGRQVTNKQTGQPSSVWDVIDGAGLSYTCWDAPLAQLAKNSVGQMGVLTYTEKQNGQYVNRSFKGFTVTPGAPAQQPAAADFANAFQPSVANAFLPIVQQQTVQRGDAQIVIPDEREARIVRQSAYKAAVDLIGSMVSAGFYIADGDGLIASMDDVRSVTEELVAFGLTGNWGGAGTPPPAAQPAAATAGTNGATDATAAPWD